jgi:hypothetical protein
MAAELIALTTRQQRIDALYKEIEPEVLAAARAIGIEGQSRETVRADVKRELKKYDWDDEVPDINLSWLLPRLACLVVIQELLSANCDDTETARAIINEDLGTIRERLPEAQRLQSTARQGSE